MIIPYVVPIIGICLGVFTLVMFDNISEHTLKANMLEA